MIYYMINIRRYSTDTVHQCVRHWHWSFRAAPEARWTFWLQLRDLIVLSVARLSIFTWKTCKAKLTWCLRRWDSKESVQTQGTQEVWLIWLIGVIAGVMNVTNYELEVDETWWNLDSCVHAWTIIHLEGSGLTSNFKALTESFKILQVLQVHSRRTLKGFYELDKTCSASSWLPLSFVEPMLLTNENGQDNESTWILYSFQHFQERWEF